MKNYNCGFLLEIFMYILSTIALIFNLESIIQYGMNYSNNTVLLVISAIIIFYLICIVKFQMNPKSKTKITMGIISLSYMCLVLVLNHKYNFSNTICMILFIPFIIHNIFFIIVLRKNWFK